MALDSQFHMPGAFTNTFKPPTSNTSSGYLVPYDSGNASTKRKRFHDDYSTRIRDEKAVEALFSPPQEYTPVQHFTPGQRINQNYALAGRLDTPGGENEIGGESMYSDSDYRRMLGSKRPRENLETPNERVFSIYPQEQQTPSQGWGAMAVNTLGGVVKGIWQFCKAGTFRGFHAGGGTGYEMDPGTEYQESVQDYSQQSIQKSFPQAAYDTDSRCSSPGIPAAKRRQTAPMSDLGNNWVMIGEKEAQRRNSRYQQSSPRNRNTAPSVTTGRRINTGRRPFSARGSLAPQTTFIDLKSASSASFAPTRSPSPSKIPTPTHSRHNSTISTLTPRPSSSRRPRASTSFAPSPRTSAAAQFTPGHRRNNSGASTASVTRPAADSPRLDAEAKQLAARRRREADDADYRISAFNRQLQDMIRQGKEALGTTVEIDGDGEGAGWESEEH